MQGAPVEGGRNGLSNLKARLRQFAGSQSIYAFKVALTVVLSLFIAFLFNLNHTYWAIMTVPLIVRPEAGTMVWRSVARMAGTLVGAIGGMSLALCFAQSNIQAAAAMALLLFLIGYVTRLQSGLDAYAHATAGFTALVVVLDTAADPTQAYSLSLARLTETMIPIFCAFIVLLTVFPKSGFVNAEGALNRARGQVLDFVRDTVTDPHPPEAAPEKAVIGAIGAAHNELRSLIYERSRRDRIRFRMGALAHAMDRVAVAATALRFAQEAVNETCTDDSPVEAVLKPARDQIAALVAAMRPDAGTPAATLLEQADAAEALAGRLMAGLADAPPEGPQALVPGHGGGPRAAMEVLRLTMSQQANALAELARAEAVMTDHTLSFDRAGIAPRSPAARRYRDHIAAVQYGLRPAIVFLIIATIWFQSGWSAGTSIAMIVPALTLLLPTIVPRVAQIMAGKALALGLGAGFIIALTLMIVLNQLEGFPELALILGATVFVIFSVCGSLQTLPLAIGSMIMIAIGLQPSNTPAFSATTLFNIGAAIAILPPAFVGALAIIFPESRSWLQSHLQRGTGQLLVRVARRRPMDAGDFFDESIDMFTDYAAALDTADPRNSGLVRRARASLVAGLACRDLRQMAGDGQIPPRLAELVQPMRDAVSAAVRAPSGEADETRRARLGPFAELRGIDRSGGTEAERHHERQFRATAELLGSLIRRGTLARPGRNHPPARPPAQKEARA